MPPTYKTFPLVVADGLPTAGTPIPNPSRPLTQGVKTSTIIFAADSGHEQRRTKAQPKATFDLQWLALSHDQFLTLKQFFMEVLNVTPFYWLHPLEKESYLVRFDMDTFSGTNKIHGPKGAFFETSAKLVQVWG